MGLFSSKKIYVSSTVYNMAGDINERPNYLKTLVIGKVIQDVDKRSFGASIVDGYIYGPGIRLRNYGLWGVENFPQVGVVTAEFYGSSKIESSDIASLIPHDPGQTIGIQRAEVNSADPSYWAEQWMLQNNPDEIETDWRSDYDDAANKIIVTLEGGSSEFTPVGFDRSATYLYVLYTILEPGEDVLNPEELDESRAELLIYKIGSGTAPSIDNKLSEAAQEGYYLPFIPVRLDNEPVDEVHFPDLREESAKAYRKLTGGQGSFERDLIKPLEENEHIDDIDYAYVLPAVALNTKENAAKKYLFAFFEMLLQTQELGPEEYTEWQAAQSEYDAYSADFVDWQAAQEDPLDPRYGTSPPAQVRPYPMPGNEIRIKSSGEAGEAVNLDLRISWQGMSSTTATGLFQPDAKVGDTRIQYDSTDTYNPVSSSEGNPILLDPINVDQITITQQIGPNEWKQIYITGLVHRNYIYGGKFVEITAKDALADTEESGFLIPIHSETFKRFSVVDWTQMSTACCYMVLNSYQVVKTGFFGSTFFKIFLVVAIVAITVATGGAGAGSAGLLGSNAAVGAALGLTGTAAIVAGGVANAIVAMVLIKAISIGATGIFGDKIGAIIGAIAGIIALQVGISIQSGASLSSAFGALLKADNIIAMTSAVGNGIAGYIQAGAMEMAEKTGKLQENYQQKSDEVSRLYAQNIGSDRARLDPLMLLGDEGLVNLEGALGFLQRTLMTGSDVADLSITMLSNFADITLSTELNL